MKKTIVLLSACLLISLLGYSQKITAEKVPDPVKKSFAKKFPSATNVRYEMEKKDYEVTFTEKEVEMSANFDPAGKWLETETEMKTTDLPKEISASVVKNFAGFKISEVAKTATPDKGLIYEMDLKKDKKGFEVQFTSKGDLLKKTPLKTGNDKDGKDLF